MAINLGDISRFKYLAHKVMPLVFDETLSYYEFLCKVIAKLNEVIDNENLQNDTLEQFSQNMDDWEEAAIQRYNEFTAAVDLAIEQFEERVTESQESFEESIRDRADEFEQSMTERADEFEDDITDQQDDFETEIRGAWDEFFQTYLQTLGVVQTTGTSTTDVMSQKAVTDKLNDVENMFEYDYGINRFPTTYIEGKYINQTNGEEANSQNYNCTDFIYIGDWENFCTLSSNGNIPNGGVRYAIYDSNKTYITGAQILPAAYKQAISRYYVNIAIPENGEFIRISMAVIAFSSTIYTQLEEGSENTPYIAFHEPIKKLITQALPQFEKEDVVKSITLGNDSLSATAETLSNGTGIELESNSIRKNKTMTFFAKINSFERISIGHGQTSAYGFYLVIDNTTVKLTVNGTATTSVNHNLTISEFIGVVINVRDKTDFDLYLTTKDSIYSHSFTTGWTGYRGNIFCSAGPNTSLSNCYLSWWCNDYKQKIWIFGDSYLNHIAPTRWVYYLMQWGFTDNLMNGFPGENTTDGFNDFVKAIKHGTPKYCIWCYGMNDADTNDAVNENWKNYTERFVKICNQLEIEPILCTIPQGTSTAINNTYKNQYVINSGLKYIDFAEAVQNMSDWLDTDGVHPTVNGARILCLKALADFPELAQQG